ncbi:MAG: hypothetical protein GY776_15855 [Alteromonas sp.]|nr:hypothetical protein [Alteromonas sp.]
MPNIMELINIDDQYKFPFERPLVAVELSLATKRALWADVFALTSGLFDPKVDPKEVFANIAKITITTCLRNGYDNLWIVCDDPAPQAAQPIRTDSVTRDLGTLLHRIMLQDGVESEHLFAIIFYCHNQIAYLNGKLSDEL